MNPKPTTLRLTFPQWQGGDITGYAVGAAILDLAIPPAPGMHTAAVQVPRPSPDQSGLIGSAETDGISSRPAVESQLDAALDILTQAAPDRVLTLGGDCAVSIAPFAWLANRYPDLGVVWIDAHPDMWDAAHQPHANARAVAILTGHDHSGLSYKLPDTVSLDRVVWVGTRAEIVPSLVERDTVWQNRVLVSDVEADPRYVTSRLRRKGVRQIAIHFDLDVLDANEFHGVAVGEDDGMTWHGIRALLTLLDQDFDLVGLTVAEHIPQGIETLREILTNTSLMKAAATSASEGLHNLFDDNAKTTKQRALGT